MNIELDKIRIDGETQRRAKINQDMVDSYADLMMEGTVFPPITLFFDGNFYWLADGFHRYFACKKINAPGVSSDVTNGTLRDAVLFSISANNGHGLPPSNEEKRNNVLFMLNDLEWSDWSDRSIAKQCGVSAITVGRLRKTLGEPQKETRTHINKHGQVAQISVPKKVQPVEKPKEKPPEQPVEDDRYQELVMETQAIAEENTKLLDRLAIKNADVTEEEKQQLGNTLAELRSLIATKDAEIEALRNSRDQFQSKNADLIKQVSYWRKRAEKAEKV